MKTQVTAFWVGGGGIEAKGGEISRQAERGGGERRRRRSRTSIRLSVNDKFFGAWIGGGEGGKEEEAAAFRPPARKMSRGRVSQKERRRGKNRQIMFLPLSPREMAKKGRQRNKRRKGGKTHFFCDFAPAPVSLKPLAKGLWSILSWVICQRENEMCI